MRMEINKEVFKQYTKTIIEIHSKGKSYLERAFYLIHLTDFISVDLAELNKLDPIIVPVESMAVCFKKFLRVLLFSIMMNLS